MDGLKVFWLAIVQGVTEFLPVSSSGHLVVVDALWGEPTADMLEVSIFLHLGTLAAVLVFYRRRIFRLLGADRRAVPLLVVATLPAVVVGLGIKLLAHDALESPLLAGLLFPVTAALLIVASRRAPGDIDYTELTWSKALLIGLFQSAAILPGLSRSGATIAAGLLTGLKRESAATFAFLMAIPAIGGAVVLESLKLMKQSSSTAPVLLAEGAAVSCAVGFVALWCLTALVNRGRLHWFAGWLIPLGVAVIVWQLTSG